jgi:hypothetical protein
VYCPSLRGRAAPSFTLPPPPLPSQAVPTLYRGAELACTCRICCCCILVDLPPGLPPLSPAARVGSCAACLLLSFSWPPLPERRRAVPVPPGAKGSHAVIPVALPELSAFSSIRVYIPQDLRTTVSGPRAGWAGLGGTGWRLL